MMKVGFAKAVTRRLEFYMSRILGPDLTPRIDDNDLKLLRHSNHAGLDSSIFVHVLLGA